MTIAKSSNSHHKEKIKDSNTARTFTTSRATTIEIATNTNYDTVTRTKDKRNRKKSLVYFGRDSIFNRRVHI